MWVFYGYDMYGLIDQGSSIATKDAIATYALLELTGEYGNPIVYTIDSIHPFRRWKPISEQDSYWGRICTMCSCWAPARMLVYVSNLPYCRDHYLTIPKVPNNFETIK